MIIYAFYDDVFTEIALFSVLSNEKDLFMTRRLMVIKIGDWVTQYSKGFWLIVDIKPKYAEDDCNLNPGNVTYSFWRMKNNEDICF